MWRSFGPALRDWYERVHPAASREQAAVAFALFGGGAVFGVLGVLTVISSDLLFHRPSWMRELGIVAAATGLPLFLLGLVAALPSRPWLKGVAGSGLAFTLAGTLLFAWWYPDKWHLTVQVPNGYAIGTYLAGISLLAAGAAAAVANYFIQRASWSARKGGDPIFDLAHEPTREEIEADLAWGQKQRWSWGGIRQGRPDTVLTLKEHPTPIEFLGKGAVVHVTTVATTEKQRESEELLTSFRGLKKPRSDTGVAAQVDHLRQLKADKAAKEARKRATLWWKVTHPFTH